MATRTTGDVINEWRPHIGLVPHVDNSYVCPRCLGPITGTYAQCFGCHTLFPAAPPELKNVVVPMTSAVDPGPWYGVMARYKGFEPQQGAALASIAWHFMADHSEQIADFLGGAPDMLTVVPSKRGVSYNDQQLRRALSMVEPLKEQLQQTLAHVHGSTYNRRTYAPEVFTPEGTSVKTKRVVLLEDTWVTGATALSAAGAILEAGAKAVMVLPIVRRVASSYWPDDHPYRLAMPKGLRAGKLSIGWPR